MTYIAKAMSKQMRLDAEAERAGQDARPEDQTSAYSHADERPPSDCVTEDLEFVGLHDDREREPRLLAPGSAARTLAGINARTTPEPPDLPPEMLGTLESPPPELAPAGNAASRPWWKEPVVIGGGALGLAALMIGFLFTPGAETPAPDPPSNAGVAAMTQDSGASASGDAMNPANDAEASESREADRSDGAANTSERKPVVVRVQIDSGDGSSVEFEADESRASNAPRNAPRNAPKQPEYYEPLPPLELPPPPAVDYRVDDPVPSSSGSRYEAPPPSGNSISDYTLEGIFWSEDNPGAIINDEIIDEGERIDQLNVLKIHRDYVEVELNGRTYNLR